MCLHGTWKVGAEIKPDEPNVGGATPYIVVPTSDIFVAVYRECKKLLGKERVCVNRKSHAFKESEITRAIRAARKAGINDPIIEVDIARKRLRIIPLNKNEDHAAINEWDIVLDDKFDK